MLTLDGIPYDERDLVGRAIDNLRPRRGEKKALRWVLVAHAFGVGCGVAQALCREFGLDPDEEVKG